MSLAWTSHTARCPHCKVKGLPPGYRLHPECVDGWLAAQNAKKAAKQRKEQHAKVKTERKQTKERKAALKTIPDLIREAQVSFNKFVRTRDAQKPCICCGKPLGEGDIGGAYDAGHYRSTGSAAHLRFNEDNCHAQRKHCNRYGAGRAVDYRIGLVARIGQVRVEALEADNKPHKWTREELIATRATYKQKLKELEKGQA